MAERTTSCAFCFEVKCGPIQRGCFDAVWLEGRAGIVSFCAVVDVSECVHCGSRCPCWSTGRSLRCRALGSGASPGTGTTVCLSSRTLLTNTSPKTSN
jgi:hypothetical protein